MSLASVALCGFLGGQATALGQGESEGKAFSDSSVFGHEPLPLSTFLTYAEDSMADIMGLPSRNGGCLQQQIQCGRNTGFRLFSLCINHKASCSEDTKETWEPLIPQIVHMHVSRSPRPRFDGTAGRDGLIGS